ncbi:MAG: response regulator [Nitrospinota bacterium]|nr:response regulator [Nitrospinota bacterium]MDH5678082.1 response regulator [Nitrospinota bacterium]MDH5755715.1 response regulator [Nitrospinota bacterium]
MTKVLVVDDEEHIRLLYSEELKDEGYEVDTAKDARDAAKKIESFKPDIITLDIRMPGTDGIEFLRKFREKNKTTPVILCTAYSDYKQDFRVWASEAYVVKSSDLTPLKNTIKEVLEKIDAEK